MTNKKLIELKSVAAGYDSEIVLNNINLTINQKDYLGIIGPNGSGKTTLLKILLGLLKPFKGDIQYFNGLQTRGNPIGYLPQFKNIDNQFPIKVIDIVLSGLISSKKFYEKFTKDDRESAEKIIIEFGISDLKQKMIGELSGGQTQRVFLCRALISSPELLILDEPDTFVDKQFSHDLNEILFQLNKKIAIVLVSHDVGSVLESVKNIACVNGDLHYHNKNEFSKDISNECMCNFHLLGHGDIPHRVLKKHGE